MTELGARVVPEIFAAVAAGATLAAVALWLTSQGIPTAHGNSWSANRISAIRPRNPAYKGRRCAQDPRTKAYGRLIMACPAIVDAALWRQANDNLAARKSTARGKGKAENADRALLASVLACPACQAPMYRIWCGPKTARSSWYRCHGTGAVPRSACRNMVSTATADALAARVIANLDAEVMTPRQVPADDHAADIERITDQLADLPRLGLAEDEEDARRAELRAERKRLQALPATEATTVWDPSGSTYAAEWQALGSDRERGDWLRRRGLKFWAAPADRGLVPGHAPGQGDGDGLHGQLAARRMAWPCSPPGREPAPTLPSSWRTDLCNNVPGCRL